MNRRLSPPLAAMKPRYDDVVVGVLLAGLNEMNR